MSRFFIGLGCVIFSLGSIAGVMLIALLTLEGRGREIVGVASGTVALLCAAFSFRRLWQRERQEREARRERVSRP